MSSIIYCSHPHIDQKIKTFCLSQLKRQTKEGKHQLIIIEQDESKPLHINSFYGNILTGIRKAKGNTVFITDHDCLYPNGYFNQKPGQPLSYCKNVFYLTGTGFLQRKFNYAPMSTLIADKRVLKECIKRKMKMEAIRWYEPGIEDPGFKGEIEWRDYEHPTIDIRHEGCFTKHKQIFDGGAEYLRHWGKAKDLWQRMGNFVESEKIKPVEESPVKMEVTPDLELPEISIIITSRNEELLSWTIDNIHRTKGKNKIEIIVGFDGWQSERFVKQSEKADSHFFTSFDCLGVGMSRDMAICRAKGEYVIIMDAHMDFKDNWIDLLLEPVRNDGKVLSCSRSVVLGGECLDINRHGLLVRHGSRLPLSPENKRRIPLDPVWHTDRLAGEIQCILGACYGFKRQRYFDIYRPWQYAVGWGSSEQVISVVNWFLGGSCMLTDAISGHLYRTQSDAMERRSTNLTVPGMFYNRIRLFSLMPMKEDLRQKLIQIVMDKQDAIKCKDRILMLLDMRPDKALEDAIKNTGLTFYDYMHRWYSDLTEETIFMESKEDKEQKAEHEKASKAIPIMRQQSKPIEQRFIKESKDGRFI